MNTFHAQILTPEGTVFDGEVKGVQMPGVLGSFEVKYNHASMVSMLDIGQILIRQHEEDDKILAVSGGFAEVNDNLLTLLAESAEFADKIDVITAEKELDKARKLLTEDSSRRSELEKEIRKAKNKLKIAKTAT